MPQKPFSHIKTKEGGTPALQGHRGGDGGDSEFYQASQNPHDTETELFPVTEMATETSSSQDLAENMPESRAAPDMGTVTAFVHLGRQQP